MKVLIYGSRGWIGQQVLPILKSKNIEYIEGNSRVDNYLGISHELEIQAPTHVMCLIGRTHGESCGTIDYLEEKGKLLENVRDNLFGPILLAKECSERSIHLTYLGTGCIFSGGPENPISEKDAPNFFGSSYSIVKGFTDRLMSTYDNVLNLRIRMPITEVAHPRNFITKITSYKAICSKPNSMTVLPVMLPLAIEMMISKVSGTVNLTNPGYITHNEILEMYRELVDPEFTWKNMSIQEQNKILSAERSNNVLDTTNLSSLFPNTKIPDVKEAIRNCLIQYTPLKKILITGGCGFIGSNFINSHFKTGWDEIVNIDALYYCAKLENIDLHVRASKRYKFIQGNIRDEKLLADILKTHEITHIIHFASQSHVQNSFEDSIEFTKDNVLGTHVLLEECRKYGRLKKFIYISTDEVYGESIDERNENSILYPTNPYSATKAAAEMIVQSYYKSYGLPVIITRGNNVFGPNQYPEKVIPKFINDLTFGRKITIQGKGEAVREFLYVNDTISAIQLVLHKGSVGEIYNIGCDAGMDISIIDLAKYLIKRIIGTEDWKDWIEYIEDRPFNDKRYKISNRKLKELGWKIQTDFKKDIEKLLDKN